MTKPIVNKTIMFAIIMGIIAGLDYINRKKQISIEEAVNPIKTEYQMTNVTCKKTSSFEEETCTVLAQNDKEFISFKTLARYRQLFQNNFYYQQGRCPLVTVPDGRSFNAICSSFFIKPKENNPLETPN